MTSKHKRSGTKTPINRSDSARQSLLSAPSTRDGQTTSGFSTALGESSATSAPEFNVEPDGGAETDDQNKMQRPLQKRILSTKRLSSSPPTPSGRYWTEYDEDTSGDSDEAYAILIDPNATDIFPGLSRIVRFASKRLRSARRKAFRWLTLPSRHTSPKNDRTPLLSDGFYSPYGERFPVLDEYGAEPRMLRLAKIERILFFCYVGFFSLCFLLVGLDAVLLTVGRRIWGADVDVGVMISTAVSFVSAIAGVGCLAARHESIGWFHRAIVVILVLVIVLVNAVFLYALNHLWVGQ